ncbi:hypothetical protein D3C87_911320 [compost metagenome]
MAVGSERTLLHRPRKISSQSLLLSEKEEVLMDHRVFHFKHVLHDQERLLPIG